MHANKLKPWAKLALIIFGAYLVWQACYHYVESKSLAFIRQVLSVQRVELDRQLDQFSFIAKILADDTEIRQALVADNSAQIAQANARLHKTQIASGLEFAFLLNEKGVTIAASNYQDAVSFVGISYSFRPYFSNAIGGFGATYFAVGATTGIPGYFIAEPVTQDDRVLGVVVTKIDLQVLVKTWSDKGFFSMLSDEYGVVILSTDETVLYSPTRQISDEQKIDVNRERRYPLKQAVVFPVSNEPQKRLHVNDDTTTTYLMVDSPLANESWVLSTMMRLQQVQQEAAYLAASFMAALLIAYLLWRVYSQQQRLVLAQRVSANELEVLVRKRTAELASAQQRLISESNFSMLGRMSAAINHEVNQPLASLRFNMASLRKLIAQDAPDEQEIEQIVVDSDRTTKRIGLVISSLRGVANRGDTKFEDFRLDHALIEVMDTLKRERAVLAGVTTFSEPLPELIVTGEQVLTQQAILNLLYNAFDAVSSSEHPAISITLSSCLGEAIDSNKVNQSARYACISVADNGHGVDEKIASSLFQPFASGRGVVDGLGLGLTISLQIAHDHGGDLLYTRSEVDNGSRFTLILPHA